MVNVRLNPGWPASGREKGARWKILIAPALMVVFALGLAGAACAQDEDGEAQAEAFTMPEDYSRTGADNCLGCHGGEENAHITVIMNGPHGVATDQGTPFGGGLQCEACHGPGGDHTGRIRPGQERPPMPAFGPNAPLDTRQENAICLNCHQDSQQRFWHGGVHESEDVGCADCHQSHVERDPITIVSTQSDKCMSCHIEQRAQFQRASAHPVRFGEMACSSCHQPHGAPNDAMLDSPTLNQNCFQCHAEFRGPFVWEHAPVTEDCSSCHQPHGSNHPGMLTRRAPLLCQQCHSRAGHPGIGLTAEDAVPDTQSVFLLSGSCTSCHSQVHGSNHPSGATLNR